MAVVHEALRAAGIWPIDGDDRPPVRLECARLAGSLGVGVRWIGIAPADDDSAVPAIAVELGRALAGRGSHRVGVMDAQGSWPCARALLEAAPGAGAELLATAWLLPDLAVLTPRAPDPRAALALLHGVLGAADGPFGQLVVDLTGFEHQGDHIAACALLDAVFVLARSGRTTARSVRRWLRDLPEGRDLGVLLTGL